MKNLMQYGLIAVALGGFYLYGKFNDSDVSYAEDPIDLNAVLDVTVDTLYTYNDSLSAQDEAILNADSAFVGFAESLAENYNAAQPALYTSTIGVMPRADSSLLAYDDVNNNNELDEAEDALFLIEVDGENARIIASSRSGAVNDHHFSGTGLLAGYLIGSMMSRQSLAGVNSSTLAKKQPISSQQAAKARAGSGSHSKGK